MKSFGRSIQLRWHGGAKPSLARWAHTRPGTDCLGMGRPSSGVEPTRVGRTGALSHRSYTLHARDHGCAVALASCAPCCGDEVGAGRIYGRRQLLDWIRHTSCARPDAGGAADCRACQTLFTATHRTADCGEPRAAGTREARTLARRWQ